MTNTEQNLKTNIVEALASFQSGNFVDNAQALFNVLGYRSDRTLNTPLKHPKDLLNLAQEFGYSGPTDPKIFLLDEWQKVHLLFQLTADELRNIDQSRLLFDGDRDIDGNRWQSYLFIAIELKSANYARGHLSQITRQVNRLFAMPTLLLFKHRERLTFAVVDRRLDKRDPSRDVLEKVTLIKDIRCQNPHRAHIEILFDLSLQNIAQTYRIASFEDLHNAWRKALDSSELNKRFFQEVANWYFWAINNATFPKDAGKNKEMRNSTGVIRLITRLIFVWFLKEKRLVPGELFDETHVPTLLKNIDPNTSTYYKAILQNLFFATLNQEMNTSEKPDRRKFRHKAKTPGGRDQHHMIHNVYRYQEDFLNPDQFLSLVENIPFLNGGLFECLDKPTSDKQKKAIRIDGFSERSDNEIDVPNRLFFADEHTIDLNKIYDTKNKRYKVRGLFHIFESYKFTIDENTPIEEEVALDPELLGRVFENLLAAYNPETGITARKQTGSFYTPREIVNYMVDESLIAHFETRLQNAGFKRENLTEYLRHLLSYNQQPCKFSEAEIKCLIESIDTLKILDPACGSGAFPMGILHKLVFILSKLDPQNRRWKDRQIERAEHFSDSVIREQAIEDIEQAFERNEFDYGRKLYLIENCLYGIDIQPIAVQIAKLRCFIALVVHQVIDDTRPNRGIRPLPNLETKFVAANTLLGIEKPQQMMLRNPTIDQKEKELADVRHRYFTARTPTTKEKYRQQDAQLREDLAQLLQKDGFGRKTTEQLANWNPYDQNVSADFFDREWMFGLLEGFDIAIGNPPYVRQEQIKDLKPLLKNYQCFTGVADLYVYFYEKSLDLLKPGGILTFISSNKYFRAQYGEKLRAHLAKSTTLLQLIDFGDAPVFTAIAYPSIIILHKTPPQKPRIRVLNWTPGPPVEDFETVYQTESFDLHQTELKPEGWSLESPAVLRLVDKLRAAGKPLSEYVNGRFYYGIKTGLNEAFVVDSATRDHLIAEHASSEEVLKPFLRGRDVKRWMVEYQGLYLIFIPWHFPLHKDITIQGASEKAETEFEKQYPAIYKHLLQHKDTLVKRNKAETGIRYEWYALQRCAATYWQEFDQPKIIIPAISQAVQYAADHSGFFSNDKTSICVSSDVDYLLGLLNSSLLWWFIRQIAATKQNGYYEFKPMYVSQIPIPDKTQQGKPIEKLVKQILNRKSDDPAADVTDLEREINDLVYKRYGLNKDEIKIIEGEG